MTVKRILIEGIGGIGGLVAAGLIKAGYAVTLVTKNDQITDAINTNGITIIRNNQRVSFHAVAHSHLAELPEDTKYDMIFLIMKATQVFDAAREARPYLAETGYFATFQNGIVEFEVEKIVGKNNVVPITVGFGGTMISPGTYQKTSEGSFHIGELDGAPTRRIAELRTVLQHVGDVEISDNMTGILWSKLAINSTINILGAITGLTLGELLAHGKVRKLFLQLYREVVDVAHAQQIALEPITSNPYLLYVAEGSNWFVRWYKDLFLRFIGRKYRHLKSSTLQSIERGRKSEIDILNGFIVAAGEKSGVKVPANKAVTKIMRAIDSGEMKYQPSNLDLVYRELGWQENRT